MPGAFETNVELLCFSSSSDAKQYATQIAAACGGAIVEIGRVEIEPQLTSFQGFIPRLMAQNRFGAVYTERTSIIKSKAPKTCSLHTTWDNLIGPPENFGYLGSVDIQFTIS